MGNISGKRILLIGFIVILLIAIPATLYILKQQTNPQSHAQKSTTLSFTPVSTTSSPITANVGTAIPLQINVNPGANLVSFVKIIIKYDPAILQTAGSTAFVPNSAAFSTVLDGPTYTSGQVSVTLSIGADATKAIQTTVSAGTITFTPIAPTAAGQTTQVTFVTTTATDTQVLSTGSSDQASENVLSSTSPAYISISGTATTTITPTGSLTPTPTLVPGAATSTPTPTSSIAAVPTPTTATSTSTSTAVLPTDTPIPPVATIAATGSTNITFGVGAVLTVVTVVGALLFFVI